MNEHPYEDLGVGTSATRFDCILCGICCSVYQVRITAEEAAALASHMSMGFYDWVGRFCDPRWYDSRSYLVRHEDGHCIFLKRGSDRRTFLCSVYDLRPGSCREWQAGLDKPECVEGLRRYWRVAVNGDGNMIGAPGALSRLHDYLQSLA